MSTVLHSRGPPDPGGAPGHSERDVLGAQALLPLIPVLSGMVTPTHTKHSQLFLASQPQVTHASRPPFPFRAGHGADVLPVQ